MSKGYNQRNQKQIHTEDENTVEVSSLIEKITDFAPFFPPKNANHVQFHVDGQSLTVDFYYVSPDPREGHQPVFTPIDRLSLPLSIAKAFVTAAANSIALFENKTHVVLPNTREKTPEDLIEIWKQ